MTARNMPETQLQDILIVKKYEDMRLIFSEKHNKVLRLITDREMTISDLAKVLGMNPGSVHYHLKELEKHGLARQVREEVKGGVVRKYYRSTAKQILLECPNYLARESDMQDLNRERLEKIIVAIEYLGYHLPQENKEDATDLLARYDRRLKALLTELQNTGIGNFESDGIVLDQAMQIVLGIKAKHDPEMNRLYAEFEKLFGRYG